MIRQQGKAKRLLAGIGLLAVCLLGISGGAFAESTVYGSGVVQPRSQPAVFARVDGTVAQLLVELGDRVEEGELLVSLENSALAQEEAQLEFDTYSSQQDVQYVRTRQRYNYVARRDPGTGAVVRLGGTDEIVYEKYSNELNIRAPMNGRVMAIYVDEGDDALAAYREHGAVMVISTDGCMKVELTGLEGVSLELGQKVLVSGEGVEAEGRVVDLRRRGMEAVIQVYSDEHPMNAPVTVTTEDGITVGEGILEINKPVGVTSYGGIIRELSTYVGEMVKREDVLAMYTWTSEPLYLANAASVREYDKIRVSLENAREKLARLAVTAPCSGWVAAVDVAEGDSVTDGTKLLTILEDAGMEVVLQVDELDIVRVKPGQKVTLELHALEGVMLTGTVEKIAPLGNTETSVTRYDVYVTLDSQDERVLGGMNVSGEISVES